MSVTKTTIIFMSFSANPQFVSQQDVLQISQAFPSGVRFPLGPGKFYHFTNLSFFSSNLDILEPKKPKLGKEKVWELSQYRTWTLSGCSSEFPPLRCDPREACEKDGFAYEGHLQHWGGWHGL